MKEHLFDNPESLTVALANSIEADLSKQLSISGTAGIALGGGNTPKHLYEKLSTAQLDWSNITVTLTDERWVSNQQPESNERMLKLSLLKHRASRARFVPLKTAHPTAKEGQLFLDQALREQLPELDVVVLGMGGDGHFASLFPDTESLAEGLNHGSPLLCLATESPVVPKERISLTLAALLTAKKIYLFITGDEKLNVYRRACLGDQAESGMLPISAVLHQTDVPVEVFWSPVIS